MLDINISLKGSWKNRFVATSKINGKEEEVGCICISSANSLRERYRKFMHSCTLREITRIYVNSNYRGVGVGTTLMRAVVAAYGDSDLILTVVPLSSTGLNKEQLFRFYSKFGFERTDEFQETMIRKANNC